MKLENLSNFEIIIRYLNSIGITYSELTEKFTYETKKGITKEVDSERFEDDFRDDNDCKYSFEEIQKVLKKFKKEHEKAAKKAEADGERKNYKIRDPKLSMICDINNLDLDLWNGLKIAISTKDDTLGAPVILVKRFGEPGNQYYAVPVTGTVEEVVSKLTQACAEVPSKLGGRSFITDIYTRLKQMLEMASESFSGDPEVMCDHLLQTAPLSLVAHGVITKWTEVDDKGNERFLCFDCDVEPLEFLVKNLGFFMKFREFSMTMPVSFSNDPNEETLKFINIDDICVENGSTPDWDFFLQRYIHGDDDGEKMVLMTFIWSIFNAKSRGRQVLYIYDGGFSGKSCLLNCLSRFLGASLAKSVQKDSLNNQFSFAKLWDKRAIFIQDNKDPNLIRSQRFHLVTGGDFVDVEEKGCKAFSARMNARVIAAGNILPEIDLLADNEKSRLIVLCPDFSIEDQLKAGILYTDEEGKPIFDDDGKPLRKGDPEFENRLFDQLPAFLTQCREVYKKYCPSDADIYLPKIVRENISKCGDNTSDICEDVFNNFFEYTGKNDDYIVALELQSKIIEIGKTSDLYRECSLKMFLEFLQRRFKLSKTRKRIGKERKHVYLCLKLKTDED